MLQIEPDGIRHGFSMDGEFFFRVQQHTPLVISDLRCGPRPGVARFDLLSLRVGFRLLNCAEVFCLPLCTVWMGP